KFSPSKKSINRKPKWISSSTIKMRWLLSI
ncbi:MAG: hypothetical protein ACI8X3_003180, partial [Saprospiraceae bacterium]